MREAASTSEPWVASAPAGTAGGACGGDGAERAVTLQGGSDHDEDEQEVRSQGGGTAAARKRPQADRLTRPAKTNRRSRRADLCRGSSTGRASPPNQEGLDSRSSETNPCRNRLARKCRSRLCHRAGPPIEKGRNPRFARTAG